MDLAYDHIVEQSMPKDEGTSSNNGQSSNRRPESTLNEDLQEAYRAFSSSSWGSWLGGTVEKVVKQGESVYREASQEVTSLGADASRSFASLRARALSLTTALPPAPIITQGTEQSGDKDKDSEKTPTTSRAPGSSSEDAPATKDSETVMSRLRSEAANRLKDIQRAEDAADEALLKFGTNIRDFFRDAIVVRAAPAGAEGTGNRFESKDDSGKRVIHSSRYDAQLHVLHTTEKSFTEDPATAEFETWTKTFDADAKTDSISADLAKYPELRANMEKLVPDRVPYADFWKRYYFLRHSIETADARRRDLLKAASAEEEIGWGDEESDEESEEGSEESSEEEEEEDETPSSKQPASKPPASKPTPATPADKIPRPGSAESSTTIHPPTTSKSTQLKPSEPRKSNDEKSQADSDTSYDVVGAASGNPSQAPSQAPNSPKNSRKVEESDDDDDDDDSEEEDSSDEEWE
ncbi:BSD-domain-containing protein [Xylaria bambusicola]|uniref:BSD-domain-containing protein n=1 Tax=Xylaria bambusicola TaxID=326684 RepID=UPI002007BB9E|nr:BSD-domain-containing protein [Xylaria bambusicola]KAI0506059.1 BSD-domain-containing protein [Xylaria bambusicola]